MLRSIRHSAFWSVAFLVATLTNRAYAQEWQSLGVSSFAKIATFGSRGFISIGHEGNILRTTNGFATWEHFQLPGKDNLQEIAFSDSLNGFIIGARAFYFTSDGGKSWKTIPFYSYEKFSQLCATPQGIFYFLDSKRRLYGSDALDKPIIPNDTSFIENLTTSLEGDLFAVTRQLTILHSTNGGKSWKPWGNLTNVMSICSLNRLTLIVVSQIGKDFGTLATTNGGVSWDTLYNEGSSVLQRVSDSAVKLYQKIYWPYRKYLQPIVSGYLRDVECVMQEGQLIAPYFENGNIIFSSYDTAKTATELVRMTKPDIYPIQTWSRATIATRDYSTVNRIYLSEDSGFTWSPRVQFDNLGEFSSIDDTTIIFLNRDTLFVTRDNGRTISVALAGSKEQFQFTYILTSGKKLILLSPKRILRSQDLVHFDTSILYTANNGYSCGDTLILINQRDSLQSNVLRISTDWGNSWIEKGSPSILRLQCVGNGMLVAKIGSDLMTSSNLGNTWEMSQKGPIDESTFLSEDSGVVIASKKLYVTLDGGKSWQPRAVPNIGSLRVLTFVGGCLYLQPSNNYAFRIGVKELFGPPIDNSVKVNQIRWVLDTGTTRIVGDATNGDWLRANFTTPYIQRSTNNGKTWVKSDSGASGQVGGFYAHNNEVFGYGSAGRKSTNYGRTWSSTAVGGAGLLCRGMVYAPNGKLIAATDKGLRMSNDKGRTWNAKDTALSREVFGGICIHPTTGVILAISENVLWKSSNSGATWSVLRKRLETEPQFFYLSIGRNGDIFVTAYSEITKSTDAGATWIRWPDAGTNPRSLVPVGDTLLLITDTLLRYTSDRGQTWITCDTIKSEVNDIRLMRNGFVAAATTRLGVIRTEQPFAERELEVQYSPINLESTKMSVYPNPASDWIALNPKLSGHVVRIYGVNGHAVLSVFLPEDGILSVQELPVGVYYARVGNEQTKFLISR